jgi:PAS domain-containing protein
VVCQDIAADGNLTPWRKAAARLGVSADAAFPIRVRGQVIGVIGIGATGAGILGDEMVALLDEMAGDIGYALQALDEVAVRKHAEEKLSESERRYRTLFEDSLEAMSLSVAGRFADVNSAWLKMHGFVDRDEVIGKDVLEVILLAQLPQLTRNKGFFHVFFGR